MRISIGGKIMMALIFVSLVGGIYAGPALGQDNYRRQGPQPRGYYDQRGYYDHRGRPVYRPRGYYHPGPRYGSPIFPVPVPSPGITIFLPFPFDIR